MYNSHVTSILSIAISALFLVLTVSANASGDKVPKAAKGKAGTLTCKGSGGIGLILGSQEKLLCTYAPAGNGPKTLLDGKITKIGLDIGIKGKSTMIWGVLASTTMLPGDALKGYFAGVSADIALGIGAGANVLVGGNNKSIVLQPFSVKGQTGINLAIGVSGLTLKPRRQ
jgi:hypothetical protein